MKKNLFSILLLVTFILTGCLEAESEATLESSTTIEKKKVDPNEHATYVTGDRIIRMEVTEGNYSYSHSYYFGGFIGSDTFVINMVQSGAGGFSASYPFYYKINEGMNFYLPISNTKLYLDSFNTEENSITFKK